MRGKTLVRLFIGVVLALVILLGGVTVGGLLLPEKHRASGSLRLGQPPEVVWAFITDFGAVPEWRPGVDAVERLEDRDGLPHYEESGRFGTLGYTVEFPEPGRKMVTRIVGKGDFGGTWTYVLEPDGDGSRLTVTEDGEIYNPVFRVLTRYVFGYDVTLRDYLNAVERGLEETDAQGTPLS